MPHSVADAQFLYAQIRRAREAAAVLKALTREGFDLCITHGNGPQIGQLALQVILLPYSTAARLCRVQRDSSCMLRDLSRLFSLSWIFLHWDQNMLSFLFR